jgi:hypothetical protein
MIAVFGALMVMSRSPAYADLDGETGTSGVTATLSVTELRRFGAEINVAVAKASPRWKYRTAIASCDVGGMNASGICYAAAVAACAGNTPAEGRGPLVDVFRMWVDADGTPLPPPDPDPTIRWITVGSTCLPEMVPGARPQPTVAMIVEAFHNTAWARASTSTQPVGNTTLVNLKTFFRATWSDEGFQPGEIDAIDPGTMFGFDVEIRPTLVGYTYHFGDGATEGPTTSPGGVYPDGDIVHTYGRPGKYTTRVDVTFGAEFRINGGAWVRIPDTVTVAQPGTVLTVREAKGVLVQN